MANEIRWAIAGPGAIADKVAADFDQVTNARLTAVGSRSLARAQAFAAKHGVPRAYGSYAELLADTDIDVVYIATPHPQHLQLALAAIATGKAVLVEKSFTATVQGAEQLAEAARTNRVFAMEAMWTRFQPAIVQLKTLIAAGAIGQVRGVQADLGVQRAFDPSDRLFDPALGGGAMLDLGVYVVSFAQLVLGVPTSLAVTGTLAPTGVDAHASLLLGFGKMGSAATLSVSLEAALPGNARVFGTQGWIDVPPRFHHPDRIVLHRTGSEPEVFHRPALGAGYSHELIEVTECLLAGKLESAVMPLADSVAVQRTLNDACEQLGVFHAEDATVL